MLNSSSMADHIWFALLCEAMSAAMPPVSGARRQGCALLPCCLLAGRHRGLSASPDSLQAQPVAAAAAWPSCRLPMQPLRSACWLSPRPSTTVAGPIARCLSVLTAERRRVLLLHAAVQCGTLAMQPVCNAALPRLSAGSTLCAGHPAGRQRHLYPCSALVYLCVVGQQSAGWLGRCNLSPSLSLSAQLGGFPASFQSQ